MTADGGRSGPIGVAMKRMPAEATRYEYDTIGGADVLQERRHPLHPPGDGEVLVDIVASGVNHIEVFIREGYETEWDAEPWPRGSGSDFAGIVRAVGSGVSGFRPGDEVIGHVRTGAHASHVTVPAGALVRKPRNLEWEAAAGLYLAGATALETLDELRIGPADTLVVSAAAGGVGSLEVQLAKHRGARVIGTCGERNFDYLRQLGILPVKYGEGMAERIRRAAGRPVTAFIDNFGKDGRAISAELGVPIDRYRSSADRREVELRLLQDDPPSVAHGTDLLRRLADLAERGAFRLLVSGLYPLADIGDAFDDLSKLHARGKIVLATNPVTTYRLPKARDLQEARG